MPHAHTASDTTRRTLPPMWASKRSRERDHDHVSVEPGHVPTGDASIRPGQQRQQIGLGRRLPTSVLHDLGEGGQPLPRFLAHHARIMHLPNSNHNDRFGHKTPLSSHKSVSTPAQPPRGQV